MIRFLRRLLLIAGVVAICFAVMGPKVSLADTIAGTGTGPCVRSDQLLWSGSVEGLKKLRAQYRVLIEGPFVVGIRWELNGAAGPIQWLGYGTSDDVNGAEWGDATFWRGLGSGVTADIQEGSQGTARLWARPSSAAYSTGCYQVLNVVIERQAWANQDGGVNPPPGGGSGGFATPTPTPSVDPSASASPTPTPAPTSPGCSVDPGFDPEECPPPDGWCYGFGPPAPGSPWPIYQCATPEPPEPTPTPTPLASPSPTCSGTLTYTNAMWGDPFYTLSGTCFWEEGATYAYDVSVSQTHTYNVSVTVPGFSSGGWASTAGTGQPGNGCTPADASAGGTTTASCDGEWVIPDAAHGGEGSHPIQIGCETWRHGDQACSVTYAFYLVDDPGAGPTPTPTATPTATPTPGPQTPPPGWVESAEPGQDGDGDGVEDRWGAPEAGSGGGFGSGPPSPIGDNNGGGIACEGKPVEEKMGYVEYDPVPDFTTLAARVYGKDPIAGLGEAIGWVGDMIWTIPNRIGNVAKWAWNMWVDWWVPDEECLDALIAAFVEDMNDHIPFSWIGDARAALDSALAAPDAGDSLPTTISYQGMTIPVGTSMDAVTDFFTPYRPWLVVWVHLAFVWWLFREALSFFGRREQARSVSGED